MKIAIYEPEPRVCGPMTWAYHLRSGFAELGHEVHVVTSTKSGRERVAWNSPRFGTRWWTRSPDVVCRNDELVDTLNRYDRMILSDVRTVQQDKDAKKTESLPVYVDTMLKTNTPWTSAFHGNAYPATDTPYLAQLLESPSWVGTMVDQVRKSIRTNPALAHIPCVYGDLPYALRNSGPGLPGADGKITTVGMTGRFIPNKGHHVLGLATPHLWDGASVELWGSCSVGMGPNPTYVTWEAIRNRHARLHDIEPQELSGQGKDFERFGNVPETPEGGNIVQPFTWKAQVGNNVCRYHGNYTDQVSTARRMGIHVDLTAWSFSTNIEFATLEAMDAGCLPVVVENMIDPTYRARVIPAVMNWSGPEKLSKQDGPTRDLADVVNALREYALANPTWRREVIDHNREMVRILHHPMRAAYRFLEILG